MAAVSEGLTSEKWSKNAISFCFGDLPHFICPVLTVELVTEITWSAAEE